MTDKEKIIFLILTALVLRLLAVPLTTELFRSDAVLYFQIAEKLVMPENVMGFKHWYEWSPAHVLFLYLTNRMIFAQIIVSVLTVFILSKVNIKLAWFWCLYPVAILYSVSFFKENLLFLFVAAVLYLATLNKYNLLLIFPVMLMFTGGSYNYNAGLKTGYMFNFWEIWKPDFNILCNFGSYWNYIFAFPYAVLIIYFIRKTKFDLTVIVIFIYTAVYVSAYGNSRFREPLMMLIINQVFKIKKPD